MIGIYRHFNGREYKVLGVAKHSETGDEMVIYRQGYGNEELRVRPKEMFDEKIIVDGTDVPLFQFIGQLDITPEKLDFSYTPSEINISIEHWAVKLLAASFAKSLGDAPNFVTTEIHSPEDNVHLEVTIARKGAKSTAQVIGELRKEIDELKQEVASQGVC